MSPGSLVVCVKGHPEILEEGAIYTVLEISRSGSGVRIYECTPPPPFNCFDIRRFVEVQGPVDINELLKEVLYESAS